MEMEWKLELETKSNDDPQKSRPLGAYFSITVFLFIFLFLFLSVREAIFDNQ